MHLFLNHSNLVALGLALSLSPAVYGPSPLFPTPASYLSRSPTPAVPCQLPSPRLSHTAPNEKLIPKHFPSEAARGELLVP